MVEKVFLDLDGVLADFTGAVFKLHDKPDPWVNNPSNQKQYDLANLWGISSTQFWEPINKDPDFWFNLEKLPHADELVNYLEEKTKVYIATSPSLHENSYYGKAKWIKKHYPKLLSRSVFTNHKHYLANRTSLLIDDRDDNINSFLKHGGKGVIFPQYWNSKSLFQSDPLKYIKLELHRLL